MSSTFVDLHGSILFSEDLSPCARAVTLAEGNTTPSRDDLAHHYTAINQAKKALLQAVWTKFSSKIERLYQKFVQTSRLGCHNEQQKEILLRVYQRQ